MFQLGLVISIVVAAAVGTFLFLYRGLRHKSRVRPGGPGGSCADCACPGGGCSKAGHQNLDLIAG